MNDHLARRDRMALIDLMVIVAAAAIAMGVFRAITPVIDWQSPWPNILASPPGGWSARSLWVRALEVQVPFLPVLCAWTLALPVLRLRHRGRNWRRLARQPGTAASLSAMIGWAWASAVAGAHFSLKWAASGTLPDTSRWLPLYFGNMLSPIGMGVAIAWAFLAVVGLWRPVPDTVDRLGRAVGVYWILVGLQWGGISAYLWMI
jgi:hypothetical protein